MRRGRLIPMGGRGGGWGSEINVTPLIDVVMCLIVFYLIVGRLASGDARPIDLPATRAGQVGDVPRLVVSVAVGGGDGGAVVTVGDQVVQVADLAGLLRLRLGEPPAGEVAVRADRRLEFGAVRVVLDACREAGLTGVKLVTERAGGGA